jgi:1-acyl-sn-glycerol-3-phosphate acyltransferase
MATALLPLLRDTRIRRLVTVPAVGTVATVLGGSIALWGPIAATADLLTAPKRLPRLRLLSFALTWSALESAGVGVSTVLWAARRSDDERAHYTLQRWWADRLVSALRHLGGLSFEVHGLERLAPGPVVICCGHSSIADSLLPAWLLGQVGMRPRYVLKDELQLDPCLDIVGNRLPNHFVDRDPQDSVTELRQLELLATGMGVSDGAVIFPEGTVMTDGRRARAIERIAQRDPQRADRLRDLRVLGPVRAAGTAALLSGAPDADLVFVTHAGLEALQRLTDAPGAVPLDRPVRVEITRVARTDVPSGEDFATWFDTQWCELDRNLVRLIAAAPPRDGGSDRAATTRRGAP